MLPIENISENVLSRSKRDVEILCYISYANTTMFKRCFFNFFIVIIINNGEYTTRMSSLESILRKKLWHIFKDSVAVIPLRTQNLKQTGCRRKLESYEKYYKIFLLFSASVNWPQEARRYYT